jgi:hypothetical protein
MILVVEGSSSLRRLRLRYRAACARCRSELPRGSEAFWSSEAKEATCLVCGSGGELARDLAGAAGASALTAYQGRHDRREHEVKKRLGNTIGSAYLFLKKDPQSTTAWRKGAQGEERLARFLERELPEPAIVLHDRRIPGSRANIDHVVVASSGVWVVDAKDYRGKVEQRDVGGFLTYDPRVFVGGRDRTKLVQAMPRQVQAVRAAIAPDPLASEVDVCAAVCFVDSNWGLWPKAFVLDGVLVCWTQHLAARIARSGMLTRTAIDRLANRIAVNLPSAARS